MCGYNQHKSFHLQVPNEFKYVTRKHFLTHDNLASLCHDIIHENTHNKTKVLLSQTIKYSIRKGSEIEFSALINVLKAIDSHEIKSEIAYALGYKIKNSKGLIEKKAI